MRYLNYYILSGYKYGSKQPVIGKIGKIATRSREFLIKAKRGVSLTFLFLDSQRKKNCPKGIKAKNRYPAKIGMSFIPMSLKKMVVICMSQKNL